MGKPHVYAVIESTPGYLPDDNDQPTFDSYAEAHRFLVEYRTELSEETVVFPEEYTDEEREYYNIYDVSPIENGWFRYFNSTGSDHDLGRIVEIVPLEDNSDGTV